MWSTYIFILFIFLIFPMIIWSGRKYWWGMPLLIFIITRVPWKEYFLICLYFSPFLETIVINKDQCQVGYKGETSVWIWKREKISATHRRVVQPCAVYFSPVNLGHVETCLRGAWAKNITIFQTLWDLVILNIWMSPIF